MPLFRTFSTRRDNSKFKDIEKEFFEKYIDPLTNYQNLKDVCELMPEEFKQKEIKKLNDRIREKKEKLALLDAENIFLQPNKLTKIKEQVSDDVGLKIATPIKIKVEGVEIKRLSIEINHKINQNCAAQKILLNTEIEWLKGKISKFEKQVIEEFRTEEIKRLNTVFEKIQCDIKRLTGDDFIYDIAAELKSYKNCKKLSENYQDLHAKISQYKQKCETEFVIMKKPHKFNKNYILKILASKYFNESQEAALNDKLNELRADNELSTDNLDNLAGEIQGEGA